MTHDGAIQIISVIALFVAIYLDSFLMTVVSIVIMYLARDKEQPPTAGR